MNNVSNSNNILVRIFMTIHICVAIFIRVMNSYRLKNSTQSNNHDNRSDIRIVEGTVIIVISFIRSNNEPQLEQELISNFLSL